MIRALDSVPQPTMVDEHPVTWWELLPEHRAATTGELGAVLRALHSPGCSADGDHDVTSTASFRTLADIQELRWVTFVFNKANTSDYAARETTSSRSSTSSPTGGEGAGDRT